MDKHTLKLNSDGIVAEDDDDKKELRHIHIYIEDLFVGFRNFFFWVQGKSSKNACGSSGGAAGSVRLLLTKNPECSRDPDRRQNPYLEGQMDQFRIQNL